MESDIVSGQQSAWVLLKKLGEGDAGEVYLVELLLEKRSAILKRPGRSAFASDVIRQTAQITNEGKILKALSTYLDLEPGLGVRVPALIDQSKPGTAFSERLFIILERAAGFDLATLAKASRMGTLSGLDMTAETPEAQRFLHTISETGSQHCFSDRILLSVLNSLLEMLEHVHHQPFDIDGITVNGILWNDVKPEHLYWDPLRAKLTIIDWGNGQFLERDGATKDRHFTAEEDDRQFIEGMGRFLETSAPDLLTRLHWPNHNLAEASSPENMQLLRERIWGELQKELDGLRSARRSEMDLLRTGSTAPKDGTSNPLLTLEDLHRQIISYGELPDFAGGLHFAMSWAAQFAQQELLEEVQEVCEWTAGLPGSDPQHLHLTSFLARLASHSPDPLQRQALCKAVEATLNLDWGKTLWNLTTALAGSPEPEWWHELVTAVREQAIGEQAGEIQPVLAVRRTLMTLQAMQEKLQDNASLTDDTSLARLRGLHPPPARRCDPFLAAGGATSPLLEPGLSGYRRNSG